MKTHTLKVRLLRKKKTPQNAFKEAFAAGESRALTEHPWNAVEDGRLFIGQIYNNPPGWRSFLQEVSSDLPEKIYSSGAGAVIFVPVRDRFAAVCFGHVHIALDEHVFERQFGLKVTLNSVPREKLRTIDLATPDAVTFQKRIQASRDSDLQDFGVDVLRDLARVAGGTPNDLNFARFVAGKDSLSITCKIKASKIHEKCIEIFDKYKEDTYKKDFSWIDNMRRVEEKDLIGELDEKLEKALIDLESGELSDLHMAPPEVVNYAEGSIIHYSGLGSRGYEFNCLSIKDYMSEINRCKFKINIDEIKKNHRIKAKNDSESEFSEKWRVYDCFVYETKLVSKENEDHYILFAGDWYKVKKSFKNQIENKFSSINRIKIIGKTKCHNESELIEYIDKNRDDLLKLDREKINPRGVTHANIEPCDFLSNKGDFIHLKDGHSSGPISHLWAQGIVSADAFIFDSEFRKKLRKIVMSKRRNFGQIIPKANQKVTPNNFCVVYGIMRKPYKNGRFDLPFFSKVSLQAAVERLSRLDVRVAIEIIKKLN